MYYFITILLAFNSLLVSAVPPLSKEILAKEVLEKIPSDIDLNDSRYRSAKEELEDLITQCGVKVIRGINTFGVNKCDFEIELDRTFFENHAFRTGFIPQKDWAFQDGVEFYEAPQREIPDNFDLRDLMKNGEPDIRQQQCGDCWAWATHHGLEIARAVHDQKALDLSVQTVLSCSREGTCKGGYMEAVDFLLRGLPLESEFPYVGYDKACKFSSSELKTGWKPAAKGTPYIGNSLSYSLGFRGDREGGKVRAMMEAMLEWRSPLVVTVESYGLSGPGVYNSCSALNSEGNHMVAIVGWEMWNGKRVAHVWNSHGKSHGVNGVSKIVWECGDGRLNRGLGFEAKIIQYKSPCVAPQAAQTYLHEILKGNSVQVGATQSSGTKCTWVPREGLTDPDKCMTFAQPTVTTEYHLTAENDCGKSSSMTLVHVWGRGAQDDKIKTPFGYVSR